MHSAARPITAIAALRSVNAMNTTQNSTTTATTNTTAPDAAAVAKKRRSQQAFATAGGFGVIPAALTPTMVIAGMDPFVAALTGIAAAAALVVGGGFGMRAMGERKAAAVEAGAQTAG